ncbi:hypothetical protein GCM10023189_35560 [Nibrella saemangeumensis]|uniref:GH26 domain-containing protein n=1 Tax=Nibrella saemangeumensis TaxID=1084526 RepID=A0ABP8N6I9_9BACT
MIGTSDVIKAPKPTRKERLTVRFLIGLGLLALLQFIWWFFLPGHKGHPWLYGLLTFSLLYKVFRMLHEWYHYVSISVPERPVAHRPYAVDVLTTACPGEPHEMIINTLEAIQRITYPHTTYLCDEGDDPVLKEVCRRLGVIHVTRTEKVDAKAGNINNALRQATGDLCVILDPDHIPVPQFLDRVVPYFEDEEVGYVQVVQAYYNKRESLVAFGAAEQTYHFYGPMMMSMGQYGTAQAIGANCTFRRAALDSIGGHAPGLAEDMHTAMRLHAAGWKSVYAPEILSHGLVPATLAAYYKQQVKWARGSFDLLVHVYPRLFSRFTWRQKLHYLTAPLYYLFGLIGLIDLLVPAASLVMAEYPWTVHFGEFLLRFLPVFILAMLIRQYAQRWLLEEHEKGFHMLGGLLRVGTWWIYLLGLVYTVVGVNVPYIPTPKNDKLRNNFWLCLPNILAMVLSLGAIGYAYYYYGFYKDIWWEALEAEALPKYYSYALFMACFAFINVGVLGFNVLMGQEKFIATVYGFFKRKPGFTGRLQPVRVAIWHLQHGFYRVLRQYALMFIVPLIGLVAYLEVAYNTFSVLRPVRVEQLGARWKNSPVLAGIYVPEMDRKNGFERVTELEKNLNTSFAVISFYQAWGPESLDSFPADRIRTIAAQGAQPLITWEPWSSTFPEFKTHPELSRNHQVFRYITGGKFDAYLRRYAALIKAQPTPVFIRFAHEADNPHFPWSNRGNNTPGEFIAAWRYVVTFFRQAGVRNVQWVWNPWQDTAFKTYFPGTDYVDWIGFTCLNYGKAAADGEWHSFQALYEPLRTQILRYDDTRIRNKPVMLAEFGSTTFGGDQVRWLDDALTRLPQYPEIRSVVFFNTEKDENWTTVWRPDDITRMIDWSIDASADAVRVIQQHLRGQHFVAADKVR